jgi:hypothetical protein
MANDVTRALSVLVMALATAGCGSSDQPPPQPRLPSALAGELATRSDKVAVALEAGDTCRALEEAMELRRETIAATNAGRVPGPFQEQLGATVQDLVARISCAPPVQEERGKGKGKHKGKHKEED